MNLDDLEKLTSIRTSSKHLDHGPLIQGQKSPYGKPTLGNSIPKKVMK